MSCLLEEEPSGLKLQKMSAVQPIAIDWVWEGFIPRGKVTLMVGEPGIGKSLLALQVAAMVTRGCRTPAMDSSRTSKQSVSPAKVVLVPALEDGVADTIRPKLEAAGADLDYLYTVSADCVRGAAPDDHQQGEEHRRAERFGLPRLNNALHTIHKNLRELQSDGVEVQLIVIDAIDRYVHSLERDELYEVAGALMELAERIGAAVLIVADAASDLNCVWSSNVPKSLDVFAKCARTVLTIVPELSQKDVRLLLPVKLNLTSQRSGLAFTIREGRIQWCPSKNLPTVNDYCVRSKEQQRNPLLREENSQLDRAIEWLRESLSDGPVSSVWLQCDAGENGISYTTLRRAYGRLGCQSVRKEGTTRWYWRLPEPAIVSTYGSADFPREGEQASSENHLDSLGQVVQNELDEQHEQHDF